MNRLTYMLLVVVAVYALTSVAIAIASSSDCGQDAPKSWVVVPPGWDCRG